MTLLHPPLVVRHDDAERLDAPIGTVRLLVDASSTGERLSTHRLQLAPGAPAAEPHHHLRSTEAFFVVDGALQLLVGDAVTVLHAGDFAAVPPGMVHAFGAARGEPADVVILITPGVERFEFFRELTSVMTGRLPAEALDGSGDRYDQVADDSPAWAAAR